MQRSSGTCLLDISERSHRYRHFWFIISFVDISYILIPGSSLVELYDCIIHDTFGIVAGTQCTKLGRSSPYLMEWGFLLPASSSMRCSMGLFAFVFVIGLSLGLNKSTQRHWYNMFRWSSWCTTLELRIRLSLGISWITHYHLLWKFQLSWILKS